MTKGSKDQHSRRSLYRLQMPQGKGRLLFSHCSIKNEIKGESEPEQVFSEVKLQS